MTHTRHSRVCAHIAIACVMLPQGSMHAAEELPGRLFFTAAERRTLEYRRQHSEPPALPSAHTPPQAFRFDGMVWRQQQLIALWIDRKPVGADPLRRPDLGRGQLVLIDPTGEHTRLDAGQHWPPPNHLDRPVELVISQPARRR